MQPRSHSCMDKETPSYLYVWCRVHMCWEGVVSLMGFGIWQKWIDLVNSGLQIGIGVAQPNLSLLILAETYTEGLWSIHGSPWISLWECDTPETSPGLYLPSSWQYWILRPVLTRTKTHHQVCNKGVLDTTELQKYKLPASDPSSLSLLQRAAANLMSM